MAVEQLIRAASSLRDDVRPLGVKLVSEGRIDVCYNPLDYAWDAHVAFLRRMGGSGARTVILGMNPGPHGMGQMGIPFAATSVVRDLLGITGIPVNQPETPDPRRPVVGLEYPREEVSGTRLWGLLSEHYGDASAIASRVFLVNHCPLMLFSGPRATNITPDKVVAFWLDGSQGLYIHPNIWHEGVFPVTGRQRFLDRQGRVHARVSCDIGAEFGVYLSVPLTMDRP